MVIIAQLQQQDSIFLFLFSTFSDPHLDFFSTQCYSSFLAIIAKQFNLLTRPQLGSFYFPSKQRLLVYCVYNLATATPFIKTCQMAQKTMKKNLIVLGFLRSHKWHKSKEILPIGQGKCQLTEIKNDDYTSLLF